MSWWQQEPFPGDAGGCLATTQREPPFPAEQPQLLARGKQSWGYRVHRSQRRISSGHKQSAAKSLLLSTQHQPPTLQKGPSRGRHCCCSMTLRGPGSQFLPSAGCGRLGNVAECCQPKERALSRWRSLAGFGYWSLPTHRGEFPIFLAQEHGWLLWGNPGTGGKIRA